MVLTLPLWFGDQRYLECDQRCGGADTYHDHYIFSSVRKTSIITCKTISFKCITYKKRISAMFPHCLKRTHLRDTFFIY